MGILKVVTSIPPQKNMVQRIAGEHAEVTSLIRAGVALETYEPSPRQIEELLSADIFFPIGYVTEKHWLMLINTAGNNIRVHRCCKQYTYKNNHIHDHHIWNDPVIYLSLIDEVARLLCQALPEYEHAFKRNADLLRAEVADLHQRLQQCFADKKGRRFIVDHGAWDYFANRYGLIQLALEYEGKEQGPQSIRNIIQKAKQEKITTIFIQDKVSSNSSQVIINELHAKTEILYPLAENYVENMEYTATKVLAALGDTVCLP